MALSAEMQALISGAKKAYSSTQTKFVKVIEGETLCRIVYDPKQPKFWADLGVHWIKAEENGKPLAVVGCTDIVHQKPCAVCAAADRGLRSMTDDESIKIGKSWKGRGSVLIQVYIPNGPNKAETTQIMEVTKTMFSDICSVIEKWGMDQTLSLERTGRTVTDTRYKAGASPEKIDLPSNIMASFKNLAEIIDGEYFKGEEPKAINAIAGITGITMPAAITGAAMTKPGVDLAALAKATPALAKPVPAAAAKTVDLTEVVSDDVAPPTAPAMAPALDSYDKDVTDDDLKALLDAID